VSASPGCISRAASGVRLARARAPGDDREMRPCRSVVAALFVLAACGDSGSGDRPPDAAVADARPPADAAAPDAPPPDAAPMAAAPLPAAACTPIEYEGAARPQILLASEMPATSFAYWQVRQINAAVRHELRQRGWKAGDRHVGFQACDHGDGFGFSPERCARNATALAANPAVLGVIGTFNSGCASEELAILNGAPGGGLVMISPTNTSVCLTQQAPGCDEGETASYYPSGTRTYARVITHDGFQAAALAEYARSLAVTRVFVLDDGEAYGTFLATAFDKAARHVGLEIAGHESWDPMATSYAAVMARVKASGAGAVVLAGIIDNNGVKVIEDKVDVLGPNDGDVKLLAPDGFAVPELLIDEAGPAAAGIYVFNAGAHPEALTGAARDFADRFVAEVLGGDELDVFALHAYQAAQILLDAIAGSDGTRADVRARVLSTQVTGGVLGSFSFGPTGDPANASGPIATYTILTVTDDLVPHTTLVPTQATVDAAMAP
jgi:branched-chain amino acid transport system substrate-binding protein